MSGRKAVFLATRIMDGLPDGMARLEGSFCVRREGDGHEGVEALVTTSHDGVPEWAWDSRELKVIANFGVGYDGIDVERAERQGVWVTCTPGVLSDAVAELALGMMVSLLRRMSQAEGYARLGRWPAEGSFPLASELCGKRLGMLGMGGVGREVALRAEAFRMEVAYHCRSPKDVPWKHFASLVDLAGWADVLCCAVPGSPETDGLVGPDVLDALGPEGRLVNVGRGNAIDEADLAERLADGRLAGAALDVYRNEPEIPEGLRTLDNALLLPHVGSGAVETRTRMANLVIDNIEAVLAGREPPNPVNRPATALS